MTSSRDLTALDVLVLSPAGRPDSRIPIAGSRAGAIGVLDLSAARDIESAATALARLIASARGRLGVLLPTENGQNSAEALTNLTLDVSVTGLDVVVTHALGAALDRLVVRVHERGVRVFAVVTSVDAAQAARAAGADAVLVKGNEAGGWVGEESTFVLLQRCTAALSIPVWAYGGVGLHTAAACLSGGAAGVVLDSQLLLTRETPLPEPVRAWLSAADGSETVCVGTDLGERVRLFSRPGLTALERLRALEIQLAGDPAELSRVTWRTAVAEVTDWRGLAGSVPAFGQDLCFAQDLARRFVTVGGVVAALRETAIAQCRSARLAQPFAEGTPLAAAHGTRYPVVQGPMTRVSDRAAFAAAVAEAGALPFLALSLMRGAEVTALIDETRAAVGDRPWGVGILGFVPPELRAEQQIAIRAARPPYALIAGGRPDHAAELEAEGIATYLHVPSPGLLALYLRDGARRFVFEGRECGGHVGPRSSFVLWERAVGTLLEAVVARPAAPGEQPYDVLFAGGVHDSVSAAMVAALAAPLVEHGVRVGVLLGTAYLFTKEIVSTGAITQNFQDVALRCTSTVLLESGPGHVTRCAPSPYAEDFSRQRRALVGEGLSSEQLRERLEVRNIGRLRVAVKGIDRNGTADGTRAFVRVDEAGQWERGLYMIGQVAALQSAIGTIDELHHTISAGSTAHLSRLEPKMPRVESRGTRPPDVAVVGIGTILPGAPDLATFWANVLNGVDAIEEIPASRWNWRHYFDPDRTKPDKIYSRWGGFVADVQFDPVRFGMPPASLRSIEPFQLLALLTAQAALHDAGYADRPFARERTSVVLGAGGGGADLVAGYMVRAMLPELLDQPDPEVLDQLRGVLPTWTEDSFPGLLMNVAAGRIANRLDLGGGNFTVDAACASSLAAVVLGVRDLQSGTSDMVLAGGVDAIQNPFAYLCFSKTQALSPTGRCRPFDANADGIAISEGYAIVALKRLADAERDGDRVYAVVRGAGSASDGRDRSLTAPRPEGQMRALRRAYDSAGFSPATVGLIEAHGTGTVAGDRAEIEALTSVFRASGGRVQATAIGSVKSMIGHTKATAGVAGLVKACLALHTKVLPPTLGVSEPNPRADFPSSPFYVNTSTRPWVRGESPRRAGVSAFGFGGTNFHVVLEEHTGAVLDQEAPAVERLPAELLLWRGQTRAQIAADLEVLLAQLDAGARPMPSSLAATLAARATNGAVGLAVVVESADTIAERLRAALTVLNTPHPRYHGPEGISLCDSGTLRAGGQVAFLFPGQGSQYVGMLRELAALFPVARRCFDQADEVLRADLNAALSSYIFPPPTFTPAAAAGQAAALTATEVAQPALGATELAALHLLRWFGLEPDMAAGHSYGELVALAAAQRLSEDDLLRLSTARGRFIAEEAGPDGGAMAAVNAAPAELTDLLIEIPGLVLANLNAPRQTVVSGTAAGIEATVAWCRDRRIGARALPVACAFHSPLVAPAQQRLAEVLSGIPLKPGRVPVFSNTTGDRYPEGAAQARALLAQHLARPVDFVREITSMHSAGARVFIEVGPGSVLTGLVGKILGDNSHLAVAIDPAVRNGLVGLLSCLGALIVEGAPVHVERLFEGRGVGRLDLAALADGSPHPSASTWLVNGGRARPNAEPAGRPVSPTQPPHPAPDPPSSALSQPVDISWPATAAEVSVNNNGNAQGRGAGSADPLPGQTSQPNVPKEPDRATLTDPSLDLPAGVERVGEVMGHYQQVMGQFLETQRSVMLAYLGRRAATVDPPRPAQMRHLASVRAIVAAAPPPVAAPAPPPGAPPPVTAATAPPPVAAAPPPGATAPPPGAPAEPPDSVPITGSAVPPPAVPLTTEQVTERLLEVVSGRTGYPRDMLGLDAQLEADLGIDSIKRVEMAGLVMATLPLPPDAMGGVETVTSARTLREVVAALEAMLSADRAAATGPHGTSEEVAPRPFVPEPIDQGRIDRLVVQVSSAPRPAAADFATRGAVLVISRSLDDPLARALEQRLKEQRKTVEVLPTVGVDEEAVRRLVAGLRERHDRIKAIVSLAATNPALRAQTTVTARLTELFLLVRAVGADLTQCAVQGGAAVLAATVAGDTDDLTAGAGAGSVEGFLRTLAVEEPNVRCKAVELDPGASPDQSADQLLAELLAGDGAVAVDYRSGGRRLSALVPCPVQHRTAQPLLPSGGVVLLTGGARGITAEAAAVLAQGHQPTLVLVGRTRIDAEEPATTRLSDPHTLRGILLEQARAAGGSPTPAHVEGAYRRLLAAREVRATLARLTIAGARVDYRTCDVQDAAAFRSVLDDVYHTYGRIDGAVHGAGTIEDRLVRDKSVDSFTRVVRTKLVPALVMAERLEPDALRFLVFFSSVSARFGNRGQADYAAANAALDRLAAELDRRWDARVVSIGWGPWAAGMVTPEVRRQFEARGVELLSKVEGRRLFEDELALGRKGEAQVVLIANRAASLPPPAGSRPTEPSRPMLSSGTAVTDGRQPAGAPFVRTFDPAQDRYLNDHRIDGRPVVPFAVALELMAEAAEQTSAGLPVSGANAVRLLRGIVLDSDRSIAVTVAATPAGSGGGTVDVELATHGPPRCIHYRGQVRVAPDAPAELAGAVPPLVAGPPAATVAELYERFLFHGPLLQGICALDRIGPTGSSALLRGSAPQDLLAGSSASRPWILDPRVLDSALQVQVLWARLHWDITVLPTELACLDLGAAEPGTQAGTGLVRHEMRIRPDNAEPFCRADHWLLDEASGAVLAVLTGMTGAGSSALNRIAGSRLASLDPLGAGPT